MPSWIRRLFRTAPTLPIVHPQATPTCRTRLGVHTLEDRVVPSVVPSNFDWLFDTDGKVQTNISGALDDTGRAMAIQSDGKIVVAGEHDYGSFTDFLVARYLPDGRLDSTFGSGGWTTVFFDVDGADQFTPQATSVLVQPDGKIVVGGWISTNSTGQDAAVFRLTAGGAQDNTFSGDGKWTRPTRFAGADSIDGMALEPDGQIVTVGMYENGGETDMRVTRLNANGTIDTSLDRGVDITPNFDDSANAVTVLSDGNILVVGSTLTFSDGRDIAVARLTATGFLDTTFDTDGKLTLRHDTGNLYDEGKAVAVQADGKYLIGARVTKSGSSISDLGVFRLNTNGTPDTTFDTDGKQTVSFSSSNSEVLASLTVQSDGKIVLGGFWYLTGPDTDIAIARLTANGALDTSFDGDGRWSHAPDLGGGNTDTVTGLMIDAAGRIVAVGSSSTTTNERDVMLYRLYGADIPLTVTSTADETDGRVDGANLSLREAIVLGNSNPNTSTITLGESLNGATIALNGKRLEVLRALVVNGPSQGATIDGVQSSQIFYVNGRSMGTYSATLRNLTLTRGRTFSGQVVIDGLDSGLMGGGILNDRADLTLENVTVTGNTNSTYSGGGIWNTDHANTKLTVRYSLFSANDALVYGGAIFNGAAATITAVNTTFSGNMGIQSGGAIYMSSGALTLVNVTATQNFTNSGTGGFLVTNFATVTIHNSIISGNRIGASTPNDINHNSTVTGSNNIIGHAGSAGGLVNGVSGNQVGVNPLLGVLKDNGGRTWTHAPGLNSPAVGTASSAVAGYSVYDQRGTARDIGYADVGAFEVQHPLATVGAPTTLAQLYTPKPSASANEAFIKGLFRSTLLREASAADVAAWLPYMAQGRAFVANGFVNSIENRDNQVRFFFRYFLGRDSDYTGIAYFRDLLRGGTPETEVIRMFILSPEFTNNNTNAQFVSVMYYSMLGRQAEPAGYTTWVNLLNNGTYNRGQASDAFLRSPEGIRRVVKSQFETYLKHGVSDAGADGFQGYSFGQVAVFLLSSDEFYANAGNNLT